MKRAIWHLRFFDGAGQASAGETGAAEAEGGKAPSAGTAGQETKQQTADGKDAATDGKKAEQASAGTAADGAKAAGPEEKNADGTGGSAAGPEGRTAEAEPLPGGDELLRKAAAALRLKAAARTARHWEEEAAALQEIYPGFSLEEALRGDKGFAALLKAGAPVKLAYEAAHMEEIMASAMRYAAREAALRMARSMAADAGRVRETPVLDRAASVGKKDVASLTEKEILKILRQVSNGEKVVF